MIRNGTPEATLTVRVKVTRRVRDGGCDVETFTKPYVMGRRNALVNLHPGTKSSPSFFLVLAVTKKVGLNHFIKPYELHMEVGEDWNYLGFFWMEFLESDSEGS